MPINEAIDAYRILAEDVFGTGTRAWLGQTSLLFNGPQYSAKMLAEAVRSIAGDRKLADTEAKPKCRVTAVSIKERAVHMLPDLLRTYTTDVPPYGCTIVDAALAISASMTFFPPAEIQIRHGRRVRYLDGGMGFNNSTSLAVQEAEDIRGPDRRIGRIVSVGTGITPYVRFEGNKGALAKKLLDICQAVHMGMDRRFGGMSKRMYCRFNPPNDLARFGLSEWEEFGEVGNLVHQYPQEDQVEMRECVVALTQP
ncbi:hypothetical protein EHS25_004798 [Saitozyma podzolica]|uniref:PNPLA domain-containing protein n=1 Tax=Saitozyma podzolica TaxID=1890683 RepID=A0A427Y2S8_9TREE|nr:hypothetical protein EHS25_004798 [Saitozyma podzolica]